MARVAVRPLDLSGEKIPEPANGSPEGISPLAEVEAPGPSPGRVRAGLQLLNRSSEEDLGPAQHAYAMALAAGVVWAGVLTSFTLFSRSGTGRADAGPLWLLVFGAVIALPIAFMLLAAYALRQGARLAAETQRARALAGELLGPAAYATAGAEDSLQALRNEIGRAAEAAADAGQTLTSLREALKGEADLLTRAAAEANRATGRLTTAFSRERQSMSDLGAMLESATHGVSDAIARQSNLVVEASDLARAGAEEAQGLIGVRVAELSSAVAGAGEAANEAGDHLASQTERLERAGAFLGERYREMEAALADRHATLRQLTETLREEQEHAAALLEGQRSRLVEAAAEARTSAEIVTAAAQGSAATVRDLEAQGKAATQALFEAGRDQQEALQRHAQETLSAFEGQLAATRDAMEAGAREALERLSSAAKTAHVAAAESAARAEEDTEARLRTGEAHLKRLAEVGRLAGEQAAQVVNAAVSQAGRAAEESAAMVERAGADASEAASAAAGHARHLAEESAALVERVGAQAEQRVQASLEAGRGAVAELDGLLQQVERRALTLPATAREQVEAARRAVAQTVQEAITATRQASRLEASRAASHAEHASGAPLVASPLRTPSEPSQHGASQGFSWRPPQNGAGRGDGAAAGPTAKGANGKTISAATSPASSPAPSTESAGLRPRLKLTSATPAEPVPEPIEAEEAEGVILFDRLIRPATSRGESDARPNRDEAWTWDDLLSDSEGSEDQHEPPAGRDPASEALLEQIQAMGVDPGALLPSNRIDEISAALHAGDSEGARDLVSRAAPAAIRRLSRRVLTDKALRAEADRHVRHYQDLVTDAAGRDREGHMTAALLSSEPGRTYLLLDAAFRELH